MTTYKCYLAYWLCINKDLANPDFSSLPDRTKGDVNNDGRITYDDVLLSKKLTGIKRITDEVTFGQYWSDDLNGDNKVDENDVALLEKIAPPHEPQNIIYEGTLNSRQGNN